MSLSGKITSNLNANGWRKLRRRLDELNENRRYRRWIRTIERKSAASREEIQRQIRAFPFQPLISVVTPVYDTDEKWLRRCLDSVLDQVYENWELCIADDRSPSAHVRRILDEYARRDRRIKVVYRQTNGHISAASNSALELARGEFCALLDHDDELRASALFWVVNEINRHPAADLIYSDEDMIDERGARYQPKFKPDWSLDFFYSLNLITHLATYRTKILREIGGWRAGFEGSQDYDLSLRFIEKISHDNIRHIPRILYHWRAIKGSVALSGDEKPYAHERARRAVREHLERAGKRARVGAAFGNYHRVRYELPPAAPKVTLITRADEDAARIKRAVKDLPDLTDYENLEIVLICSPATREKLSGEILPPTVKIVVGDDASEAANYNAAVAQSDGEILCFLNADLRPAASDWLRELAGFAWQTEIGAAGAKILDADGATTLHGGIVLLGANRLLAAAAHRNLPRAAGGAMARAQVVNNFSATAIDCLATRRTVFQEAGGFDGARFPNRLFDVDFCLKIGEKNLRVVWTPYAELVKVERRKLLNVERKPSAAEREFFQRKWSEKIERDSFYNPNFSRRKPFTIDV